MKIAILGASDNPDRYANLAQQFLVEAGHSVIPVTPSVKEILGVPTLPSLADITEPVDTLTIYVGPGKLVDLIDQIIALKPRRVIFNPGTEAPELEEKLNKAGINTEQACTLVLLRSGQFET